MHYRAGFLFVLVVFLALPSFTRTCFTPVFFEGHWFYKESPNSFMAVKKLCLVRWLEDESLSVCPSSSIKAGQTAFVGAFAEFKWAGKYYEGEVLEMSGECLVPY